MRTGFMSRGRSGGRNGGRGGRTGGRGGPRDGRGPGGRGRDGRDREGRERGRVFRKKVCRFCGNKRPLIDYKDTESLQRFITEKGKIIPRRITGSCSKHLRRLAATLKRSRQTGLLAFQTE